MKNILMKTILMKKVKNRMCILFIIQSILNDFKLFIKYSYNLRNFKACKKANQKFFFIIFFLYIKMRTNYFQKQKEKFQKEARESYQNLSEEEKNKMRKRLKKGIKT